MKAKMCDSCNSEVVVIRKGNRWVAECSYCGYSPDKGYVVEDFMPEFEGDESEE